MEYTVATPIGQLFVVDRNIVRPMAAGAEISVALSDHGVALVPGEGDPGSGQTFGV
jgi:iron(III) transport system ATP-binding protein